MPGDAGPAAIEDAHIEANGATICQATEIRNSPIPTKGTKGSNPVSSCSESGELPYREGGEAGDFPHRGMTLSTVHPITCYSVLFIPKI